MELKRETHGGEETSIYASGPWSHLFHATHDQTYINHVMKYAGCLDNSDADHCTGKTKPTKAPCSTASITAYTYSTTIVMLLLYTTIY